MNTCDTYMDPIDLKHFIICNKTEHWYSEVEVFFNRPFTMACKCWVDWGSTLISQLPSNYRANIAEESHAGLLYEAEVYKMLTKYKISGTVHSICSGSIPLYKAPAHIKTKLYGDSTRDITKLTMHYIITESAPSCVRLDLFDDKDITEDDADCIVLQILYTLQELKKYGIRHTDLHNGNILIDILSAPATLHLGDITLCTKYVTKIFDWNRALAEALGDNINAEPPELLDGSDRHTFLRMNTDIYAENEKLRKIKAACIRAVPSYADGVGDESD